MHTIELVVWLAAAAGTLRAAAHLGVGPTLAVPAAAGPALLPRPAGLAALPLPVLLTGLAMKTGLHDLQHGHREYETHVLKCKVPLSESEERGCGTPLHALHIIKCGFQQARHTIAAAVSCVQGRGTPLGQASGCAW